jgi:signal transduction histidine kinase
MKGAPCWKSDLMVLVDLVKESSRRAYRPALARLIGNALRRSCDLMNWRRWSCYLFPDNEKKDPVFREEISRLAVVGLRIVAGITFSIPLLMLVIRGIVPSLRIPWAQYVTYPILGIGFIAGILSLLPQVLPFARVVGWMVGAAVALTMVNFWLRVYASFGEGVWQNPGPLTSILLIGVICLPLKPWHTLSLGLFISTAYLIAAITISGFNNLGVARFFVVELFVWTFVCTILTAVIYAQRSSTYKARRQILQSFEDLCNAQSRLLLSENAAAQVRLAAALSHELNSPVGVLNSAVNSLLLALKKQSDPSADRAKLDQAIGAIGQSAEQSCQRLNEIIRRLQRFTNLDRAEVSVVNVNELLVNAVELLPPHLRVKANVNLDLQPVPPLKCRPQQLNAVFANLLRNATESVENHAGVFVSSSKTNGDILVRFRDQGRGIPPDRLTQLFEPGLVVKDGRVSIGNWGLFNSRSILVEHGGNIEIESLEGHGTTVTVRLPLSSRAS